MIDVNVFRFGSGHINIVSLLLFVWLWLQRRAIGPPKFTGSQQQLFRHCCWQTIFLPTLAHLMVDSMRFDGGLSLSSALLGRGQQRWQLRWTVKLGQSCGAQLFLLRPIICVSSPRGLALLLTMLENGVYCSAAFVVRYATAAIVDKLLAGVGFSMGYGACQIRATSAGILR